MSLLYLSYNIYAGELFSSSTTSLTPYWSSFATAIISSQVSSTELPGLLITLLALASYNLFTYAADKRGTKTYGRLAVVSLGSKTRLCASTCRRNSASDCRSCFVRVINVALSYDVERPNSAYTACLKAPHEINGPCSLIYAQAGTPNNNGARRADRIMRQSTYIHRRADA